MAIKQLPVSSDSANYQFKTDLDGTTYIFKFRFNTRSDKWMMDISTEDGIKLLSGIPLLVEARLINRFVDVRLPQGTLFLINTKDEYVECGRYDLGNDCLLLYSEAA